MIAAHRLARKAKTGPADSSTLAGEGTGLMKRAGGERLNRRIALVAEAVYDIELMTGSEFAENSDFAGHSGSPVLLPG